jgi:hypothetical protein
MTYAQLLQPPFVVVARVDRGLAFFREIREILEDSFDCLWGREAYEAWDATGRRFLLRRTEKPQHWEFRLLGTEPARLSVDQVAERPEPDAIRTRLVRWIAEVFDLQPPPGRTFDEMALGELFWLALPAEERRSQRR